MGIHSSSALSVAALTLLLAGCGTSGSANGSDTADGGADPLGRTAGSACTDASALVCALDDQRAPTGDVLACEAGVFVKSFTCATGSCGTLTGHGGVRCGTSTFVAVGGACDTDGSAACSPDRTLVAVCRGGLWAAGHHCGSPICDFLPDDQGTTRAQCGPEDLYSVGDLCTFPFGHGVCSVDHASVLDCGNDGMTKVLYACTAAQSCKQVVVDGGPAIQCDPPITMPMP